MKYTENETISQKQLFSQASVSMLGLSLMAVPEFMRFSLKSMIVGLILTGLFFWVQSIYFVRVVQLLYNPYAAYFTGGNSYTPRSHTTLRASGTSTLCRSNTKAARETKAPRAAGLCIYFLAAAG